MKRIEYASCDAKKLIEDIKCRECGGRICRIELDFDTGIEKNPIKEKGMTVCPYCGRRLDA